MPQKHTQQNKYDIVYIYFILGDQIILPQTINQANRVDCTTPG